MMNNFKINTLKKLFNYSKLANTLIATLSTLLMSNNIAIAQPVASISTTSHFATIIKLPQWQTQLQYQQPPRLAKILADIHQQMLNQNNKSTVTNYHEGYQLFNLNKQALADKLHQQVLSQLSNLAQQSPIYATDIEKLYKQLANFKYVYREKVNLDWDAIRLKANLNPKLAGNYLFRTTSIKNLSSKTKRPTNIQILGLAKPQLVPFNALSSTNDYLQSTLLLNNSNTNKAWLIAPNGNISQIGYANWNKNYQHLLPGTIIWVGFANPTPKINKLERDITNLLSMRITQTNKGS